MHVHMLALYQIDDMQINLKSFMKIETTHNLKQLNGPLNFY